MIPAQNIGRTTAVQWARNAATLLCLTAAGCSAGTVGQSERAVDGAAKDVTRMIDESRAPMTPAATGRVSVDNARFIPASSRRAAHGIPLPATKSHISVTETIAQTLPEIARTLSRRGGIPVSVSADLEAGQGPAEPQGAPPSVSPQGVNAAISRLGAIGGGNAANLSDQRDGMIVPPSETRGTMALHWDGLYSGLLDQISAKFGTTYTYDGASILISRNITRTYTIHALATSLGLTQSLTGSGINGGSGGASNGATANTAQTVSSSITVKVWDDIVAGVNSLVGKLGTVTAIGSTGTITVSATPSTIDNVQEYVDQQNRSLENEITVTVQILTVTLNNSDNDQFDLSAAIASHGVLARVGNLTPSGSGAITSGAITPGVSIVSGGTTATLQAISALGRVSSKTQAAVTTMNGFVAPFQLTNTRSFVATSSVTNTGSSTGGSQTATALVPGTVTTGFNIAVLPRVDFADGTVLMQYGVSISTLAGAVNGFDVFVSPDGRNSIQLANVNQQAFINNAEVPNGDTVVITGYNQDLDTANKTGFGTPGFYALSGSQFGSHARQMTVILITPTVVRVAHSVQTSQN